MGNLLYEPVIKEIKERLGIVDLIETYVSLKRSGKNFVGLCPFHDDKNPSMYVSEEKGVFHCFGCGAGGDVFAFLMKYKNISFSEAVEELAKRLNLKVYKNQVLSPYSGRKRIESYLYKINRLASLFYHRLLIASKEGLKAREYLRERGISGDVIKEFEIGYAPGGWDTLLSFFKKKNVPLYLAEKVGLLIKKENKRGYYDRFRERIVFPIRNVEGMVIGFGGRALGEGQPKYINSPESEIYHKGSVLYGLDKAREHIRSKRKVVLVEGYMDLLSLFMIGIKNVVATLGTSFTQSHARLLKRYTDRLVVIFDGDEAGIKASLRVLDICLEEELFPFMVVLPRGEDPASFVLKGLQEEFSQMVENSRPLLDFFIEKAKEDFEHAHISRKEAIYRVVPLIAKLRDPIERSHYVKRVGEVFGIRENDIISLIDRYRKGYAHNHETTGYYKVSSKSLDRLILKIILKFPKFLDSLLKEDVLNCLMDPDVKSILGEMMDKGLSDISSLLVRFPESSIQGTLSEAILYSDDIVDEESAYRMLRDCLRKVKLRELENRLKLLRVRLDRAVKAGDHLLEKKLLGEYKNLVEEEKKIRGEG